MLRAAGAKLEPMSCRNFPANALGFILSAEGAAAFDDLTRSKDVDAHRAARRVAEHVPHLALHPRGRVHPRPARAHAAQPPDGRADVAVRRVPVADRQRDPRHHQPDRPSGGVPEGRLRRRPPLALMITGRLYDEATVLRVALAYERATKWHTMNPVL